MDDAGMITRGIFLLPTLFAAAPEPAPPTETPIWPLLQVVFASILEVLILCVAGYVLAGKDILDKKTQKQLNRLNVSLFTPCLLFSKVAFFLNPAKLRELWVIPIFFIIVTLVSMSVAFTLGTLFRLKKSQRSFAMAAAMFMNSNSLPIALMQSLVVTVPGLKWGNHDNKNAMVGRALTYLVLYSTLGMVLRWSYGVRLLAQADDELVVDNDVHHDEENTNANGVLVDVSVPQHNEEQPQRAVAPAGIIGNGNGLNNGDPTTTARHFRPTPVRKSSTFYASFPNSPTQSRAHLSPIPSSESTDSLASLASSNSNDSQTNLIPKHHAKRTWSVSIGHAWASLNDFMTVPLWAALASLIVACIAPLQHALSEHMQPVKGALGAAGNCSIPVTLIVLGAYFYTPKDKDDEEESVVVNGNGHGNNKRKSAVSLAASVRTMFSMHTLGPAKSKKKEEVENVKGETKTVVIAVVSRMLITPMLLLPVVALGAKFDLQRVFDDPVFILSNVLLISSPPALTLAQITQAAASGDAFERLISRTIFWAYCVLTPPTVVGFVVLGLVLAKL